ncbi:MAG TPA: hypothetical protein VE999_23400 [Gemmataceae bacterium]|nr:hypothetical protein [Gemmataceae bacterium]
MTQNAPPLEKIDNRNDPSQLVPPDEKFWQHYSPHGEFPLSSAGSLVVHLLIFGLLGLMAWLGVALFSHSSRSLPVEAVRLDLGGGGGNPRGEGDGPNTGAMPQEAGDAKNENATESVPTDPVTPPKLDVNPTPQVQPKFENDPGRVISTTEQASQTFASLRKTAGKAVSPNSKPPGYGKGGKGQGGGSGDGEGKGTGSGKGDGPGNLTKREKRQLRWTLLNDTYDFNDYVNQLQGLGAILAIPVRERGDDFDYVIVKNLSARPAKVSKGNIEDVRREVSSMIRWVNENPRDAAGIIHALGLPMPQVAQDKLHFFACLPEQLEQKLLQLEIAHLHKRYPNREEDDIKATTFHIIRRGGGKYEPVVKEMTLVNDQKVK